MKYLQHLNRTRGNLPTKTLGLVMFVALAGIAAAQGTNNGPIDTTAAFGSIAECFQVVANDFVANIKPLLGPIFALGVITAGITFAYKWLRGVIRK